MCLMAFALNAHPDFPLILVANRDEFHNRPTLPSQWWQDDSGREVLSGRDVQAGGTWLGLSAQGTLCALTNVRDPAMNRPDALSRGALVMKCLHQSPPEDFSAYNPLNLVRFQTTATRSSGTHWNHHHHTRATRLTDGFHAVSNADLDTPWPKLLHLKAQLERIVQQASPTLWAEALFNALSDRQTHPDASLPDTGVGIEWERMLSAAFIVSPVYGTRCSTVVMLGREGLWRWEERSFAPDGSESHRTVLQWASDQTA